jgi:hypothetical protein
MAHTRCGGRKHPDLQQPRSAKKMGNLRAVQLLLGTTKLSFLIVELTGKRLELLARAGCPR